MEQRRKKAAKMIDKLKCYLDGLFATVPDTSEVTVVKSKLYNRMKQEYAVCVQKGLDQQAAYESAVESIGDISDQISQLKKRKDEPPVNQEATKQPLDKRSKNKVGKFIRDVPDITSGLLTGMLNKVDPADLSLVNTVSLPLDGVDSVKIAYLAEGITLNHSSDGNFVVREYMNQKEPEFFAEVKLTNNNILVKHGKRKGLSLRSSIEVSLPAEWNGRLAISSIYGSICTECDWNLSSFSAKTVGGNVEMTNLAADTIKLSSSVGSLILESCTGKMELNTVGGEILVDKVTGGGIFGTIVGNIRLYFGELSRSVKLSSENGEVFLHLPQNSSFEIDAVSIMGAIYSSFKAVEINPGINKCAHGFVGKAPYQDIEISTSTGGIHISG